MSYDNWKLATPPEYEERESDQDAEREEALAWFASLEAARFDAAHSGEGDDMMDPDKMMEPKNGAPLSLEQQQQIVNDWIDAAPVRELKRIKIRCDGVVDRRRAALEQESKELASWEKPHRATRSDKGTTRAKENAA
jgi:hypothetical protein